MCMGAYRPRQRVPWRGLFPLVPVEQLVGEVKLATLRLLPLCRLVCRPPWPSPARYAPTTEFPRHAWVTFNTGATPSGKLI
jgi:hypothetical protein